MDSIAEQQRQAYEDVERMEQAVVDLMLQKLTKHRYRLIREQKISNLLDQIQARSKLITDLDLDESGLRAKEINMMKSGFDSFYAQLDTVRAHHRRNPELSVQPPELDYVKYTRNPEEADEKRRVLEARLRDTSNVDVEVDDAELGTFVDAGDMDKLETMFSGDERFGRYVDLNEQHDQYINLRGTSPISYVEYLDSCMRFGDIPAAAKDTAYGEYVRSLGAYFESYFARAMPLFDLPKAQREANEAFEKEWSERKENDMDVGLFCEPCQRMFEKESTYKAHMSSRKHQKTVERLAKSTSAKSESRLDQAKRLACLEHKVQWYARALGSKLSDTRANVQRRQALTEDERMHELHDMDETEYSDDDAVNDHSYNPLNLPLGWDGKPIPFWLYKLHGLGVTFSCEICGNSVYRGRSAYERHFQEPRHATNMRRLGIPNTRQFHGVASISEALELWARVDSEQKAEDVDKDTFEEYEDAEGNVFSKKTYFDLKRQGLI
ncbi:Pre-mRNA-splicing factor sap61 [Coemansia sp. RSA 1822]|nr:Pre-mRNA-splicing factor sap61 [Coemansia sp. RSA 638]KAJ2542803.1 Pre-mRNA-splicing factor sap61 [Coemansia sp. RSA 1853]KAJ2565887.1 Pre-mRNA-splicing factor sap61 [Coemansia sp. RSA 1822]